MGIYDRDYYRDSGRGYLEAIVPEGRACKFLILATLLVFGGQILTWNAGANGDLFNLTDALVLRPAALAQGEIWRLFTFFFAHHPQSFFPLIWNMLFLWWLGSDLEQMYGSREFLFFYLAAGVLGGIAFTGVSYLWGDPARDVTLGAAGAITAVTVLFACHFPNHTVRLFFLIPVPIWLLVVVQIIGDASMVMNYRSASALSVVLSLTGVVVGGLYYKKQFRLSGFLDAMSDWQRRPRRRSNLRIYRPEREEAEAVSVAASTSPMVDEHLEAQVDAVLEKMARVGKESLTDNERQILMRASEIYKKRRN